MNLWVKKGSKYPLIHIINSYSRYPILRFKDHVILNLLNENISCR